MGNTFLFVFESWHGYGIFLLKLVVGLAIIAAAAWVLVRTLRPQTPIASKSSRIQVLERLVVEPKRTLYLIEVDGQTLLIGSSEKSIQLIRAIHEPARGDAE